jgi:predicted membrane channel-forming protein YqfA (hemolysin III family)
MTEAAPRLVRRLRLAGLLVSLGLLIEAATLFWQHPTAFLAFLFLGGSLVAVGVILYLLSIATSASPRPAASSDPPRGG